MADDFQPIYTPGSGAPAYDGEPQGPRNSAPPSSSPPADAGGADTGSGGSTTPQTGADTGGPGGDSGLVDALNGDSVADSHVPGAADVTVGSDLGGGSLLDLGNLV
jgi:hypothetical protein